MQKGSESKEAEIRRKIVQSGISQPQQYEEIISNLITQRERLQTDLNMLRDKVVALQQKQAKRQLGKTTNIRRPSPARHPQVNYREELDRKYDELKLWQKKSVKAMKNSAVEVSYRAYLDKLFSVQQQIQVSMRQLYDERKTYDRLKKALRLITKDDRININVQSGIERENHLLKKRVGSLKKIVDRQLSKEIDLQNCLVEMKELSRGRDTQIKSRERESQMRRRVVSMATQGQRYKTQQIQSEKSIDKSLSQSDVVSVSIDFNKVVTDEEIYQIEGRMNRIQSKFRTEIEAIQKKIKQSYPNEALQLRRDGSKLSFGKQFDLTFDKTKAALFSLQELNEYKTKLLFQLKEKNQIQYQDELRNSSSSEIKGLQHKHKISDIYPKHFRTQILQQKQYQIHSPQKTKKRVSSEIHISNLPNIPKQTQSIQIQTDFDYVDDQPLRRQFIGIIGDNKLDDRNILKQHKFATIKTLYIFYSQRGIACIKTSYNLHESNRVVESQVKLSDSFLQSYCKVHTIDTSHDDFIRYFKVKYNAAESRITGIKIVTNRNVKNGFGDNKIRPEQELPKDQNAQKQFIFDIGRDQFPVSIFCSHIQKGPYWYLCGLGVQINDL